MDSIKALGDIACAITAAAASDYLRSQGITAINETLADRLGRSLPAHCKRAVDKALTDAAEAVGAGMGDLASATFMLEFRLAGIRAAKEALQQPNP